MQINNLYEQPVTVTTMAAYVHSQMNAVDALEIAQALKIETMSENLLEIEDMLISGFDSIPNSKFVWCVLGGKKYFYHQKTF